MGCAIRNVDELCLKWRDMRAKCSEFNGIYNFVINNIREADINPVNVAKEQCENKNDQRFRHVKT